MIEIPEVRLRDEPFSVPDYTKIVHDAMKFKHWDCVTAIVGREGSGKSTLNLHFLDAYERHKKGYVCAGDAETIGGDLESFLHILLKSKSMDMIAFDESGELSSRDFMTVANKAVSKTFQKIRGRQIFTVLILPRLWALDKELRYRITHLFVVERRVTVFARDAEGKEIFLPTGLKMIDRKKSYTLVSYYSYHRKQMLLEVNESKTFKGFAWVSPTCRFRIPDYQGVLAEPYAKIKTKILDGINEDIQVLIDRVQKMKKNPVSESGGPIEDIEIPSAVRVSRLVADESRDLGRYGG
jgi:hypothetical protein